MRIFLPGPEWGYWLFNRANSPQTLEAASASTSTIHEHPPSNRRFADEEGDWSVKDGFPIDNWRSQYVQESSVETSLFRATFLNTHLNMVRAGGGF